MNRRTAVVSLLGVGLMAWFLRGANLGEVWRQVRQGDPAMLGVSLLAVAGIFVARTIRWRYLLSPLGPTRFRTVFRTTIIGFGALGLLPVRVGDVIRPYLLARQERLSTSSAFATVVMERVLDLMAVLVLLAVYVWGFAGGSSIPPHLLRPIEVSAAIAAATAVALFTVMWTLAAHPERIGRLAAACTRVLPGGLSERVGRIAHTFSTGFAAARDPRTLVLAACWSLPIWLAIAAQAWAATVAYGIAMPYPGTFLLQALLVIGVAVPTPGGVGSFHEAYRLGVTTFFGAPADRAIAAAIVTHVISFLPPVLLGVVFMAQDGLSLGRLERLAASARGKEGTDPNEVPVLRSSGR